MGRGRCAHTFPRRLVALPFAFPPSLHHSPQLSNFHIPHPFEPPFSSSSLRPDPRPTLTSSPIRRRAIRYVPATHLPRQLVEPRSKLITARESSPGVASLASRISGLNTGSPAPVAQKERPKPNTANPLFGKALAGVKERAPKDAPKETEKPAPKASDDAKPAVAAPADKSEEKKKEMADDGESGIAEEG